MKKIDIDGYIGRLFAIIYGMRCVRDRAEADKNRENLLGTAILSNDGAYTVFSHGGQRLKFQAPRCLRRYVRVKTWSAGYLEVDADYGPELGIVEEYIDLRPVLRCLMIRPSPFLKPIRKVEISNARKQSTQNCRCG